MNKIVLDKYDCKVITAFKRDENLTVEKISKIWTDRCGLPENYHNVIHFVNEHFLELARSLELFDNCYRFKEFVYDLQPQFNWKFICGARSYLKKDTTDFELILLSRLDSLFRNTEVIRLPGFKLTGEENN